MNKVFTAPSPSRYKIKVNRWKMSKEDEEWDKFLTKEMFKQERQ